MRGPVLRSALRVRFRFSGRTSTSRQAGALALKRVEVGPAVVEEVVKPGRRLRRAKSVGRPINVQNIRRHDAAQVAAVALGQQHDLRDQYGQSILTVSLQRAQELFRKNLAR